MASFPDTLIRLSREQLAALGLKPSTRRAATPEAIRELERGARRIETFSNRQFEQWRTFAETGQFISKEKRTKRLQQGRMRYRTPQARKSVQAKRRYKSIRDLVPTISDKDMRLIDKKNRLGWNALTDKEKKRFKELFATYNKHKLLPALGSPPVAMKTAA